MTIAESFPAWLTRRYGDQASQAGHLARIIAGDASFPPNPTWPLVRRWIDAAPFESADGYLLAADTLKELWESYERGSRANIARDTPVLFIDGHLKGEVRLLQQPANGFVSYTPVEWTGDPFSPYCGGDRVLYRTRKYTRPNGDELWLGWCSDPPDTGLLVTLMPEMADQRIEPLTIDEIAEVVGRSRSADEQRVREIIAKLRVTGRGE